MVSLTWSLLPGRERKDVADSKGPLVDCVDWEDWKLGVCVFSFFFHLFVPDSRGGMLWKTSKV